MIGKLSEIDLEIILRLESEEDIAKMCVINRRFREVYNMYKETIERHIMRNIYGMEKPSNFRSYTTFYKHMRQSRKYLWNYVWMWKRNDNPSNAEMRDAIRYWYTKVVNPQLVKRGVMY